MSSNTRTPATLLGRTVTAGIATAALSLGVFAIHTVDGTTPARADTVCGSRAYQNSDGVCTPEPDSSPTGIRCKDGSYSHATHRQGACSNHGGIDESSGAGDPGTGSAVTGSALLGAGAIGSAMIGSSMLPILLFGS